MQLDAAPRGAGDVWRTGKLLGERLHEALHVVPVVAILVAVLGGIYTGFVTPTEAAVGALLLAAGYRRLTKAWSSTR